MTDIRPSPEMLDAAAANRAEAAATVDLATRLALHRALAHAETWIPRLHVGVGGSGRSTSTWKDGAEAPEPGTVGGYGRIGWTGVEFAPQFIRFIDESFGVAYPWSAGLKTLRLECRRSHSEHWQRDEWHGSLCYTLTSMVCRFGWSYEKACYALWVTPERTERTLQRALRRIEDKLAELQARATETVHADAGRNDWQAPAHVHVGLPGAHRDECLNPVCRRLRAA
jgi:hypothetical protein